MVAASDLDLAASAANVLIPGDLRDIDYADGLAKAAHDALGGLDIVVNNAGIITRGAITETTDDNLARTMAINFDAPFRICRAAIPLLEASGGGAIVNTSSCWGVHPGPAHPLYCASKAAVAFADPMPGPRPCPSENSCERGLPAGGRHTNAAYRLRGARPQPGHGHCRPR